LILQDCENAVFDLDGTIADTAEDIQQALATAFAEYDLPPVDVRSVRLMIGGGERLLVTRALDRLRQDADELTVDNLVDAFHREYVARANASSRLFPGVRRGIERLHAQGARLGICSNKPDDLVGMLVRDLGLAPFVSAAAGARPGQPRKPDPKPLLDIAARLGSTPERTLYVGDSDTDVRTARAAGCPVVLVSYGYTVRPARQLGADAVVDSVDDIRLAAPFARSA